MILIKYIALLIISLYAQVVYSDLQVPNVLHLVHLNGKGVPWCLHVITLTFLID